MIDADNFPPAQYLEKRWITWGLECVIVRCPANLCGYVLVPREHPDHDKHYDHVDVDVHGGLTFHLVTKRGTWFGFDCGHHGDYFAAPPELVGVGIYDRPGKIWTVDDVAGELEDLARQLQERA